MSWLLGLTGSIGMGKSTTAQMFRDLDIPVWDADACVHKLYAKGGAAVPEFQEKLPEAVIDEQVSRSRLRELIATDPQILKTIEDIVHPLVGRDREAFKQRKTSDILVFDIPLLFETGAESWLDSVLVVTASNNVQRERVLAREGMTEHQLNLILSRQMPDSEKRARADHVIETVTLDQTREAVNTLIKDIRSNINHA